MDLAFTPDYDVAIIGSGPSACAAAINCRKFGLSVLIVTDQTANAVIDPFQPSESINGGITSLLGHLNATKIIERSSVGKYAGIKISNSVSGADDIINEHSKGYHINKSVFNKEFLKLAMDKQVAVLFNDRITGILELSNSIIGVKTISGQNIIAKYTIDASGKKRVAGKYLGLKESFHSLPLVAWSGKVTDIKNKKEIFKNSFSTFIFGNNGWVWLAPESTDACTFTCLSLKGKQIFSQPDQLDNSGTMHKIIKYNMRWRSFKTVSKEGLIICGDAGAIIDPAAGNGILNAIYSGIKAAETIANCLSYPEKEFEYLNHYAKWFINEYTNRVEKLKMYYSTNQIFVC